MTNIVIYARFSSHSQTEQSIEGQLRVCHEYATRNGYNVVNEYIDRAISGTSDNRPAFLQMIADSKNKSFEYILVYKLDRFSRNKYDSVVYKHKLKENGVKVISATETISDTPEGALMEGLLEMMAEMYSQDLSQKVKRGIRESILKGNFIGGNILYGYKVVDKKIVIDKEKSQAVKLIFNEYANGTPKKKIIELLNSKGFKTNKNKPFTLNSLNHSLSNKKYIGIYDNGEYQNDNYYPAIIDKHLFERVQQKLKEHKQAPATQKAKIEYLLTGKCFCGYCGASMVGISGTSKTKERHHYYTCKTRWTNHSCNKANEKKNDLEEDIVKQTQDKLLQPQMIEHIVNRLLYAYEHDLTNTKIKEYQKQLNKIEREQDKCFDMVFNANTEEIKKRANEKSAELTILKQDLLKELKKLELAVGIKHTKQDLVNYLLLFIDGNYRDKTYQKKMINNFIHSIYIFDDDILVFYNMEENRNLTYEQVKQHLIDNNKAYIDNGVLILSPMLRQVITIRTPMFGLFFFC